MSVKENIKYKTEKQKPNRLHQINDFQTKGKRDEWKVQNSCNRKA